MAKESKVSIGVTVEGDGTTNTYVPPGSPMTNPAAPAGGTTVFTLAAGANTIPIPAGAIGVVISPPTASSNAKTLQGNPADIGIILRPNAPLMLNFGVGQANIEIASIGVEDLELQWL